MQQPPWRDKFNSQSTDARLLLANDVERRRSIRKDMRKMLEILLQNTHPCKQAALHGQRVAVPRLGIDIVGALPLKPGRRNYAIVATDYFTK